MCHYSATIREQPVVLSKSSLSFYNMQINDTEIGVELAYLNCRCHQSIQPSIRAGFVLALRWEFFHRFFTDFFWGKILN